MSDIQARDAGDAMLVFAGVVLTASIGLGLNLMKLYIGLTLLGWMGLL